jgi:quinoprotein glucose dehydrogenase
MTRGRLLAVAALAMIGAGLCGGLALAYEIRKLPAASPIPKVSALYHKGQLVGRAIDRIMAATSKDAGRAYWVAEDSVARARLPLYRTIPASPVESLTPARALPSETFREWHRSHGDPGGSKFSLLDQINTKNVNELTVAWIYRSGDGARQIQCNPVVAGRLIYLPTAGHAVVAIDGGTGKEVWRHVFRDEDPAKRGLTWWAGRAGIPARIYFSAGNTLVALDAVTGRFASGFGDGGVVHGWPSLTAPAIAGDVLVRATLKPSVEGFDVATGSLRWSTDLNDEDMGQRHGGRSFRLERGNPWGGSTLDEGRGIFYVTTGNPGPEHVGTLRPGDNAYTSSVSAFDVRTGARLWRFQEVRHDLWDLDIPAPPILTSITRSGRRVDVVAAPTKLGNTLLLDRLTGRPIFDFRLRRAPTSTLLGEHTAEYQPDVQLPEPFVRQEFSPADITTIGAKNRTSVLEKLRTMQYGFFRPPAANIQLAFLGSHGGAEWPGGAVDARTGVLFVSANHIPWALLVVNDVPFDESSLPMTAGRSQYLARCSNCHGNNREGNVGPNLTNVGSRLTKQDIEETVLHGRAPMPPISGLTPTSLDALTNYLLTRDREIGARATPAAIADRFQYYYVGRSRILDFEGYPGTAPPWGTLSAVDLNAGKILWQVPLGEYPELTARGIPRTGTENFGGPTVTAGGLVFVGGTKDGKFRAFDESSGKELWSAQLPFGGYAPSTTYEVDGRQFVVIPATGGGVLNTPPGDALVAFALPEGHR